MILRNIKIKYDALTLLKILIFLQAINYTVGVIILNDTPVFKYLRDIVLLVLFFHTIRRCNIRSYKTFLLFGVLVLFVVLTFIRTVVSGSKSLALTSLRKYMFPIIIFFCVASSNEISNKKIKDFLKWLLLFMTILSVWGIFQAWVLGGDFLVKLGYPITYSYAYDDTMLRNSFYFGNLGIQRVVSTFSNTNVCALVFGMVIIFMIYMYQYIELKRWIKNVAILCIVAGYVVAFSRSNILAAIIVIIFFAYKYIPHRSKLLIGVAIVSLVLIMLYFVQGENGLIYKIVQWIGASLNFTESSAAGRTPIWEKALDAIIKNPLGIGFGKVGSLARDNAVQNYYACENSYLAVGIDMGVLALFTYILSMFSAYSTVKKLGNKLMTNGDKFSYRLSKAGCSILIYFLIVSFFSNHIYDMEVTIVLFGMFGIVFNKCINCIYKKQNHCPIWSVRYDKVSRESL